MAPTTSDKPTIPPLRAAAPLPAGGGGEDGVVVVGGDGESPLSDGGAGVAPPEGGVGEVVAATTLTASFWPWLQWLERGQMK